MVDRTLTALALGAILGLSACQSGFKVPPAWDLGGQTAAYHQGPLVAAGETGPRRFMIPLMDWFSRDIPDEVSALGFRELSRTDGSQMWIMEAGGGGNGGAIVLRAKAGGVAAATLLEGARHYGAAIAERTIDRPTKNVIVCLTPSDSGDQPLKMPIGPGSMAQLILLDPVEGPCRMWRSSDPGLPGEPSPANGLNLLLRLALVDVGMVCRPWKSVEIPSEPNPWDLPTIRLAIGDSGVDLSRTDQPDVSEAQRAGLALWATAGALAGPRVSDLDRYLDSLLLEARLRHHETEQVGQSGEAWKQWLAGARHWTRLVVLGFGVPIGGVGADGRPLSQSQP